MIDITPEDAITVLAYKTQVERERGYNGFVAISINRLAEIYMDYSCAISCLAIKKAQMESRNG